MEKLLRDLTETLNFSGSFFEEVESLGKMGFYEADLVKETFKASANFKKLHDLPEKKLYRTEEYHQLIHPEDYIRFVEAFDSCLTEKRNFDIEYRVIIKEAVRHFHGKAVFIQNEMGVPVKIVGVNQDISGEKYAEAERIKHLKNLDQTQVMVDTIVHDLKGPMNNISMIAELLTGNVAEGNENLVEVLKQSSRRSCEIIEEMLENSLSKERKIKTKKDYCNISSLVSQAASTFFYTAQKKNIEILISLEPDVFAFVFEKKLLRAMENLISNAVKFSFIDSKIEINLYRQGEKFIIKVTDSGLGMNELQKASLFHKDRPAMRIGTNGEKSFGKGLNIVKRIINQHNGEVKVESQESVGTKFYLELPVEVAV